MALRLGAFRFWTDARDDTPFSALAYLCAAVALGHAIQLSNGSWSPGAVTALSVALALAIAAVARIHVRHVGRAFALVALAGIGFQLWTLQSSWPAAYLRPPPGHGLLPFFRLLLLFAIVAGAAAAEPKGRWTKHLIVAALVLLHLAAGTWILQHAPQPWVDVDYFHRSAVRALMSGESPYAQTIPNIYGHTEFYGEGMVEGGRVLVGFPYPPLSLLFSLPSALTVGDHRYSGLVAMAGAAALMSYARPGYAGVWAASLLLSTPRTFFVLEHGWTEPFVVFLLALSAFVAARAPKGFAWPVALLLSIKQYNVLAIPSVLLAIAREDFAPRVRRVALVSVAVGAALILPFLLWDFAGFYRDVIAAQFRQPFRTDALSYLSHLAQSGGPRLSPVWSVFAVLIAQALIFWRAPRTPSGMCGGVALTFAVFFAFNKQAFANYYYLVIGALCCAAAVSARPSADGPQA